MDIYSHIYLDMSYTLQVLLEIYDPLLKHTDEKVIVYFHSCMLKKHFVVVDSMIKQF
jgi:hypothetical protein